MPTPAEIAAASSCFRCLSGDQAAVLYLLSLQAGMPTPAEVAAGASCWSCVPDFEAAVLFLLNEIDEGGGGGGVSDAVTCGAGAPSAAPASGCGVYIDTATDALYIYRSGAWVLKA